MSEQDLAARSVAAVTGWVTDIEAAEDAASGGISTYVHIEPDQVVFGSLPGGALVLREPGGRVRGRSEWIFGSAEYTVGEEVLVFLSRNADGTLRTTGMSMGKFTIASDERGMLTALRQLGEGAALWDLKRGALISHPGPESYELPALLAAVRAAAPAGATRSFSRGGAVTAVPPELSHTAEREHQESFTYLSTPSRWFEPDDGQPVSFVIDANGDAGIGPTTSRAAINDAFAAWSNVPTSDLTLSDGGTNTQVTTFAGCDGGNRIAFNDPFNEITDPVGCSGVLAIGGFCASSEKRTVNGTSFNRIRVGKVMFNNGWSSCPGWNRCNLSEVATHEIGHTLGFGHSPDLNATMYASAHFDGRCASLRSDDLAAINFVYPSSGTPVPSATATPLPPTATATRTRTASATPTLTPTVPTATATRPPTLTPTSVATATRPPTLTPTRVATATVPPTRTASATPSDTAAAPAPATSTPTAPRHSVHGRVHYYSSDRGVPDVTVNLRGDTQDATQTSIAGDYQFDGVPSGVWELAADKASDFGGGVTPLDAAYVLQAVANLRTLDASQQLACDVTGDGQLSALDAARILQFSVGTMTRLPVGETCGSDWSFVPEPVATQQRSVVDPSLGDGTCHNGKIVLDGLPDDMPDQNFRAILFGDCTGNWDPVHTVGLGRAVTAVRAPRVRLGKPTMDGTRAQLQVFVRAPGPYNALDLRIAYDATRLAPANVAMRRPTSSGLTSFYAPETGVLRVAMATGEPIMRRFGVLLTVEFTLVPGASDPGDVQALAASIDEVPAVIAGSAALRR